jgi:hypothetical protein
MKMTVQQWLNSPAEASVYEPFPHGTILSVGSSCTRRRLACFVSTWDKAVMEPMISKQIEFFPVPGF